MRPLLLVTLFAMAQVISYLIAFATNPTVVPTPARGPSRVRQNPPPVQPVTPFGLSGVSGAVALMSVGEDSAGG